MNGSAAGKRTLLKTCHLLAPSESIRLIMSRSTDARPEMVVTVTGKKTIKDATITFGAMLISTLAISGVPLFAGFFSKDMILAGAFEGLMGHTTGWNLFAAVILPAAAAPTAFYMFRLILMTFFGQPRDAHLHDHAHESPSSMTIPLIVLAAGALVVGLVAGYPLEHGWINHFLEPVLGAPEHVVGHGLSESVLIGISVLAGVSGLVIALVMHRSGKLGSPSDQPFHKVLWNKWYVDEAYQASIVQPIYRFSMGLWTIVDTIIVDGVVNGLGYTVKGISWVSGRFQTGRTPTYAMWMLFGTIAMIYAVTLR